MKRNATIPVTLGVFAVMAFTGAALLFVITGQQSMDSVGDFFGIIAVTSLHSFYIMLLLGAGVLFTFLALVTSRR